MDYCKLEKIVCYIFVLFFYDWEFDRRENWWIMDLKERNEKKNIFNKWFFES